MTAIHPSLPSPAAVRRRAPARLLVRAAALCGLALSVVPQGAVLAQVGGRATVSAPAPVAAQAGAATVAAAGTPTAAAPDSAISLRPRRDRVTVSEERDRAALEAGRAAMAAAPGPADVWGLTDRDWDWMSADLLVRKAGVGARVAEVERAADGGDPKAQLLLAYWLATPDRLDMPRIKALYEAAGATDFPRARVGLSWTYFSGFGQAVDMQAAYELCAGLLETRYTRAMTCAAGSHEAGLGAPRDATRMMDLLLRAASLGSPSAMIDLAWAYAEGKVVERNMGRAGAWLDLAIASGDLDTHAEAGSLLLFRPGPLQDVEQGLALVRQAAEAGSSTGLIQLAMSYRNGLIGDPDEARALELLEQAAAEGDGVAMLLIGAGYLFGEDGLEEDPEAARTWLEQAVLFGSNRARGVLGAVLLEGLGGIEADPRRAIPLLRAAVEAGEEQAMISLGVAYEQGIAGIRPDPEQAVALYRRAHEAEWTTGTFFLANMAADGSGMNEDPGLARALWREAAEKDHVDAMLSLASALAAGYGGPVDTQEAMDWAQRARDNGDARQRVAARRLIRAIEELGVRDGST